MFNSKIHHQYKNHKITILLFLISFLLTNISTQLLNVDIFNIFNLSKHQAIIDHLDSSLDKFMKNLIQVQKKQQGIQEKVQKQAINIQKDLRELKQQIKENCTKFFSQYSVIINKNDIVIFFNKSTQENWTYPKSMLLMKKPNINEKTLYLKQNSLQQQQQQNSIQQYFIRKAELGVSYQYQFKLDNLCILKDSIKNYFWSQYSILAVSFIYIILNFIVLPPSRKYLSQISRRSTIISLIINLQMLTLIFFILMLHLMQRIYLSFQFSFSNIYGIFQTTLFLFVIGGYWIGISFCLKRRIQRFQFFRNICIKISNQNLHTYGKISLVSKFFIIILVFAIPILFIILPKGIHFHFYGILPIYSQLLYFIIAKSKTKIPIRYMLYCLLANQFLILTACFYPVYNFYQVSFLQIYLLELLYGFSLFLIMFISCCCYFKNNTQDVDTNDQQNDSNSNKLSIDQGKQMQPNSDQCIVKQDIEM